MSFTQRHGQRQVYYVCRAGKKQQPRCPQQPIRADDLQSSLREQLERRDLPSGWEAEALIRTLSHHSGTRCVSVERSDASRSDASRFAFVLPVPVRPGVCRTQRPSPGRTLRVSQLMALALHFQRLVSQGAVPSYRALAEAGHVSRARLRQILQPTYLAPEIQEQLLFLPATRHGVDRVLEKHLRGVARAVDWQTQRQRFRPLQERLRH